MGWLLSIFKWAMGKLFTSSNMNTAERNSGEKLGQQETQNINTQEGLHEIQDAVDAGEAARTDDQLNPVRLRDGSDPAAKPYRPGPD